MGKKAFYVIGNWKSNKTLAEVKSWVHEFKKLWQERNSHTNIILCPSAIHLFLLKKLLDSTSLPITLGLQNISSYSVGAYTGEISASQVKGVVSYCLVGHSERRKYFAESDTSLEKKAKQLIENDIQPIYCVQDENQSFSPACQFIAYEPVWAIGTGKPEPAENANRTAKVLKSRAQHQIKVIYGGSVTDQNVAEYSKQPDIDGVLPGGASLKPDSFYRLLINAHT